MGWVQSPVIICTGQCPNIIIGCIKFTILGWALFIPNAGTLLNQPSSSIQVQTWQIGMCKVKRVLINFLYHPDGNACFIPIISPL